MSHLSKFLSAHALKVPSGTYPVKDLLRDFLATLPPSARGSWRRSRLLAELASEGYIVALDPRARAYSVAGIVPKAALEQVNGELLRAV